MPWSAPRHCQRGHKPFSGRRCPQCEALRVAARPDDRPSATARGYGSRWARERKEFLAVHPTCVACGKPANTVDHVTPHRGDALLMWDRRNWQAMCWSCHSRKTATQDSRFARKRCEALDQGGGVEATARALNRRLKSRSR